MPEMTGSERPTRVTLADVAAEAGVSNTTVSMILNDRDAAMRISADTAARVRAVAAALNYRPNRAARLLRVGKTQTIGFVSDYVTITRYASAMIRGLLDVAGARSHTVLMAETGQHPERMDDSVQAMLDNRPDGLIFGFVGARQVKLPKLPRDVPIVLINAVADEDVYCVLPDERQAGRDIAQVLVDAGHRRIAIIGDHISEWRRPELSVTIGVRLDAITATLAEAGIEPVVREAQRLWLPDAGYDSMSRIIDRGTDITAVICLNDNLAFGAYQALNERGLRVPDDISIVSFDDDEFSSYLRPKLTTAGIPYEQMGRTAVDLLLNGLEHKALPESKLLHVPMPLRLRNSVRSLR